MTKEEYDKLAKRIEKNYCMGAIDKKEKEMALLDLNLKFERGESAYSNPDKK